MESLVYKKKVLAEAKMQEDKEDKLRRKADEEHRKDVAILQAARQQRKVSSNGTVMDKLSVSQNEGRLSLADHDWMTQILQQLSMDMAKYKGEFNPEEDTNIELQEDLTEFIEVHHGKKKSPAKAQPKPPVDSAPRTSHHQPQRTDLPPLGQEEDDHVSLHCHPKGQIEDQIQVHQD